MPRKSKATLSRSAAAKQGAQRRRNLARARAERALFQKRSDAAKKGWVTRRLRQRGIEPPHPVVTLTRLKYKRSKKDGGKVDHIEVIDVNGTIQSVRVNGRLYDAPGDLAAIGTLLAAAEPDDDGSN